MSNSFGYDAAKVDTAISNLEKVESSLDDLYTAISSYKNSFNSITYNRINNKIENLATKYDENNEEYVDPSDESYYWNYYGTPLKNAISNVETLKNAVPAFKSRAATITDAFNEVKSAVALYEEIPAVGDAELGLPPDTGSVNPDASYSEFDRIASNEGLGSASTDIDLNEDGKADLNIDTDGDGKADINIDLNGDGKADTNIDVDGDGKADINIDLNGDGKADLNVDTDGDGKADINIDTNKDGVADTDVDTDGDGKAEINVDTNEDGRGDTNIDIDGDGKADINIDTNNDGIADTNIDLDGDGKADVNVDVNGDGVADLNIDTDGDGIADTNIDANGNGIIDSQEKKKPDPKPKPEENGTGGKPIEPNVNEQKNEEEEKKPEEGKPTDDLVDVGEVIIPDIGGEDDPQQPNTPGAEDGNKGAGTISNVGTAIADSVTSVEDELIGSVVEEEQQSIPDALLGSNGAHGMSEFNASGSYKNAQGPAAQAGVGIAGVAALGIAAASGGTAISGVIEENNEDSDFTSDELNKRKRIRTIITSCSLVVLSLGFTLTQILRPGSVLTILLFGIAILVSAVASIFGTNIGKTITTITSLLLLFVTFLLSAFNVVSPLGYIIALIALLTIFLIVYTFDLFKEFVDNKVMIPSFVAVVALNAFGLLKVFNVVNWLIYLLLAGLGIAVYLWYERYYGQGFEVVNKLKNEDKRIFFN